MASADGLNSITGAEHIGPTSTGDNIEAKRTANYIWDGNNWVRQTAASGGGGTEYTDGNATPTHPIGGIPVFDNAGTITAVSAANPLPTTATIVGGGDATAANQTTEIAKLTSIDGKITAVNTGAVVVSSSALPTGAATSAKQPALGTAGTASADVITVQGKTGMTAVVTDGSGVTQPVSATSLPLPTGAANQTKQDTGNTSLASIDTKLPAQGQALAAGSVPVVLPSAQITTLTPPAAITGFATSAKQDTGNTSLSSIDTKLPAQGQALAAASVPVVLPAAQVTTLTPPAAITGFSTSTKQSDGSQKTQVVDGSGNVIGATSNALDVNIKSGSTAGTQYADGTARGTATGNLMMVDDGTNIQSAAGTTGGLLKVDLSGTGANSTAVKTDGSAVTQPVSGTFWQATQPVSGTVTANAGSGTMAVSAASLPLPALAATSTKQSDGSQKSQIVDGSGNVIGATSNALDINIKSGNPSTLPVTNTGTFAVQQTTATVPAATTMQSAATGNGNGTSLNVAGYATAVIDVTASVAMSGGTTINFEVSPDDTTWYVIQGTAVGTNTKVTTATAPGNWQFDVAGYKSLRARISAYSAGTITAKGYTTLAAGAPDFLRIDPTGTTTQPVSLATNTPTLQSGSTTAVTQATAASLNATVVGTGTFAVQAAESDGANVTLGAKADAKSTATDTTPVTAMSVLKQISASVQAPPSQAVTNAGTFAVQSAATLAAETTKVIGTVRQLGNAGAVLDGVNTAATAPANGILGLGIYNSTEPSPTTGQSVGLQQDSKGRLRNVIMDAAGNTRGANVNSSNQLSVTVDNTPSVNATLAAETTKVIGTVNVASSQTIAVTNAGTFAVQAAATLAAETTKVIGTVRTADGTGNLFTTNSTTYTAKNAQDANLLGTLGTAFTTAGKVDVKGADGDVFVRQATASNLNATVVGTGTFAVQADVAKVNGATTLAGNGASGTGAQRVTIASDSTGQVAPAANATATGTSIYNNTALSSTKQAVNASAGNLYGYHVYNPNSVVIYIQLWNVASASVTVGTTAPTAVIAVPPVGWADSAYPVPINFGTALTIAATTTSTGAGAPSTALLANLWYK